MYKTPMLASNLCEYSDYSDAWVVVKERIDFTGTNAANRRKYS